MSQTSLEEQDPGAAIRVLEKGIADRKSFIQRHRREIERHDRDIEGMRETLGMVRARNPDMEQGDTK